MSEDRVRHAVNKAIADHGCLTVLDVGCGDGKYLNTILLPRESKMGIDAWPEGLDTVGAHTRCVRAGYFLPACIENEFDAVICLDMIEHVVKGHGLWLLDHMKRVAAKLVIVFTPNGFMASGMTDNPNQEHLSGWFAKDLERVGFEVEVWRDFDHGTAEKPGALWAVWHA